MVIDKSPLCMTHGIPGGHPPKVRFPESLARTEMFDGNEGKARMTGARKAPRHTIKHRNRVEYIAKV